MGVKLSLQIFVCWKAQTWRRSELIGINISKFLVGKSEGKKPLSRSRRRLQNNIKKSLEEIVYEDVDWIHVVQITDQWRNIADIVMNLQIPLKVEKFLIGW